MHNISYVKDHKGEEDTDVFREKYQRKPRVFMILKFLRETYLDPRNKTPLAP